MPQKIKNVFLTILTLMLINCSTVFATEITTEKILEVIQEYNSSYVMSDRIKNRLNLAISQHEYSAIMINENGLARNHIYFYFYNEILPIDGNKQVKSSSQNISQITIEFDKSDKYYGSLTTAMEGYFKDPSKWYTESGFYTPGTTEFATGFEPGATNMDIMKSYKIPYFEFSANEIGTTTIENFDENLPCFYPSSFDTGVNSYASYKKIGKIYIDENYTLDYIYGAIPTITVSNLSQTSTWKYQNYLIFTDNIIENGYKTYYVNIDKSYINTPYVYSMEFISYYPELGQNIFINFVLLTETQQGGEIIVESGDTEVSGDFTKDETTLGDIQNTINNIFQKPNEDELKKQQEENINKIKEQISGDLNNNKVFSALTTAEQGLIELLSGTPRRF